jgi:hypothetical protein
MRPSDGILEWLNTVRSLSSTQIATARESAEARVRSDLGTAPDKASYLQEIGKPPEEPTRLTFFQALYRFLDPLDYLIFPLLAALLVVSAVHMFHFAADIAVRSYQERPANWGEGGIWIGLGAWIVIHQLGLFGLSEIPTLYFYTRYKVDAAEKQRIETETENGNRKSKRVSVSGYVLAALSGVLITLIANIVSLLHGFDGDYIRAGFLIFVGAIVPSITMFLGHRISEIIREVLSYNRKIETEFQQQKQKHEQDEERKQKEYDVDSFEYYRIYRDPSLSKSWYSYLGQAIVEYYKRHLKSYTKLEPEAWTPEHEVWLGRREVSRMNTLSNFEEGLDFFVKAGEQ